MKFLFIALLSLTLISAFGREKPHNGATFISNSSKEIKLIRVDKNKTIRKYPSPSKVMEYNIMKVNGRSPMDEGLFIYNNLVHFMIYVKSGNGKFFVGDEVISVRAGDMLDVPPKTRFAAHGDNLEYVTVENPAWYPEQFYIVNRLNEIVKKPAK